MIVVATSDIASCRDKRLPHHALGSSRAYWSQNHISKWWIVPTTNCILLISFPTHKLSKRQTSTYFMCNRTEIVNRDTPLATPMLFINDVLVDVDSRFLDIAVRCLVERRSDDSSVTFPVFSFWNDNVHSKYALRWQSLFYINGRERKSLNTWGMRTRRMGLPYILHRSSRFCEWSTQRRNLSQCLHTSTIDYCPTRKIRRQCEYPVREVPIYCSQLM